jgi:hypothetical protein
MVCLYGLGSKYKSSPPEHCGFLSGRDLRGRPTATSAGTYTLSAASQPGDSGGPVYMYKYKTVRGVRGVVAVGVTLAAGSVCTGRGRLQNCRSETEFVPINDALTKLGVSLKTS